MPEDDGPKYMFGNSFVIIPKGTKVLLEDDRSKPVVVKEIILQEDVRVCTNAKASFRFASPM